ncbi:haloacid dehalogenase-like hydrolase [bacterium]|nr:haloacid dehalogenase-like hydrolase [bacterium]
MSQTIAIIFDFDDTLLPDSTSELLESRGIDSMEFWRTEAKALLDRGYDPTHAYLNLILDRVGEKKELGLLSNKALSEFGATLDETFYPGVKSLFRDLKKVVAGVSDQLSIEFYIISGGLQAVMDGSPFIKENFTATYGCQFGECPETGLIKNIKRAITFTEKTRYLFEINKGITPGDTQENQYVVNIDVNERERRIPFKNMIYLGDGHTDVPCFSLVKKNGGIAFGIFRPGEESSARKAFLDFLRTDRVLSTHAPKYTKTAELGALLRIAVRNIADRIIVDRKQAEAELY